MKQKSWKFPFDVICKIRVISKYGLVCFVLFFFGISFSQISENARVDNTLKMTFPSIYFKHRSVDYASMPYSADSCYRYIAAHIDDINDFVIWRDTLESEKLSRKRIRKIKSALNEFKGVGGIFIVSMEDKQKISRLTIDNTKDSMQVKYLMNLNSVFEISQTSKAENNKFKSHLFYPRPWCIDCWRSGFHIKARQRLRKLAKKNKLKQLEEEKNIQSHELIVSENQNNSTNKSKKESKTKEDDKSKIETKKKKKVRRRLVWTGWKTGFRWSASGK